MHTVKSQISVLKEYLGSLPVPAIEEADEINGTDPPGEPQVTTTAVNWHAQRRVLLNGSKTVIFD